MNLCAGYIDDAKQEDFHALAEGVDFRCFGIKILNSYVNSALTVCSVLRLMCNLNALNLHHAVKEFALISTIPRLHLYNATSAISISHVRLCSWLRNYWR